MVSGSAFKESTLYGQRILNLKYSGVHVIANHYGMNKLVLTPSFHVALHITLQVIDISFSIDSISVSIE